MNLLVLLAAVVLLLALVAVVAFSLRRGVLPHLLVLTASAAGVAAVWLGLRQLWLPASGGWHSVALIAIGIAALLACAVAAKRLLPRSQ